jgi:transcription initiation factor TFIID subunit TAF12
VVRIFIGLLIGFILGVAGAIQFLSSGRHLQIMTSPQVQQLEEQVKQGNQQIEQLTKKLEAAAEVMEKTAAKFSALESRVETLHPSSTHQPEPSTTKPLAEEPPSTSPPQPIAPPSPS